MSHPARVRGLKLRVALCSSKLASVAPCAGAWIETLEVPDLHLGELSHPARVRGLKLDNVIVMRGVLAVAPCAGAWIETQLRNRYS